MTLPSLLLLVITALCSLPSSDAFAWPFVSMTHHHHFISAIDRRCAPSSSSPSSFALCMSNEDGSDTSSISKDRSPSMYTPLDRPLLAIVDTFSLTIFAAIGKSSHSSDGSLDLLAILVTAFPFITAWLATSPVTSVYSPDERSENMIATTAVKVLNGWALAVPLGVALRGVIKGYVPPVPFIFVTLISTLIILVGVRVLFNVMEDFFVELVN
eukprot:scaffold2550_cov215-Alexandrium_tamarense.AAC.4